MKCVVVIPTYNEADNIGRIVPAVLARDPDLSVLVVDDNSPDGTAAVVKALPDYGGRVRMLERPGKAGLGAAYIAGFQWVLANTDAEAVFEMDADFSHDPDDLVRLYKACSEGGADMSVGSRYVKGGHVRDWSWDRIVLSYCASLYVRLVLWLGVRDTTAGFVCYKAEVLRTLELDKVRFIGYAFQIEMKYRTRLAGYRIAEVPITFVDRLKGTSKMSMNIFREALWGVLQMRFGTQQRRRTA